MTCCGMVQQRIVVIIKAAAAVAGAAAVASDLLVSARKFLECSGLLEGHPVSDVEDPWVEHRLLDLVEAALRKLHLVRLHHLMRPYLLN